MHHQQQKPPQAGAEDKRYFSSNRSVQVSVDRQDKYNRRRRDPVNSRKLGKLAATGHSETNCLRPGQFTATGDGENRRWQERLTATGHSETNRLRPGQFTATGEGENRRWQERLTATGHSEKKPPAVGSI